MTTLVEAIAEPGEGDALGPALRERSIWIAWESHRRSRELAGALGIELRTLLSSRCYVLRVALLSLRTVTLLVRTRPRLVFVQNPSLVLATIACLLRRTLRYRLVVDRHSNFRLHETNNRAMKWRVFHRLSRYTIRAADLTIVTNQALRALVEEWGGRGFVLPDRLPMLPLAVRRQLGPGLHAVFICSHEEDEPIREVLEAAASLPAIRVHITGRPTATLKRYRNVVPPNVRFTGYLPEAEYQSLLASCDVILSLTNAANTLLCGAYEAVAAGKPLVLSNQTALTDYFSKGCVTTNNTTEDLARAMNTALSSRQRLTREVDDLKRTLNASWCSRWRNLLESVTGLVRPSS